MIQETKMTIELIDSNLFAVVVEHGPHAFQACHGYVDLSILLRNIAMAGALTKSYQLGQLFGKWWAFDWPLGAIPNQPWHPNSIGISE